MADYRITTKSSWSKTQSELAREFDLWGVHDWDTNYPRGARLEGRSQSEPDRLVNLRYVLRGKTVNLSMGKQDRAVDNLRVLYLCIQDLRMNEKRGLSEIMEQAYLQIAGPSREKSPWEILSIFPGSPLQVAEAAYKAKAIEAHPDRGGSNEVMSELNQAIEKIRKGLD